MDKIIRIQNLEGQPVVTSRQVAEDFEKEHKNIIRDIENLIKEDSSILSNGLLIESSYKNTNNRNFKEYLLTRDGFSLLVMGFTGAKALQWKLKYIEAFNTMESSLKESNTKQLSSLELLELQFRATKEVKQEVDMLKEDLNGFKEEMPLFNIECHELQNTLKKKGVKVLGGKESAAYKDKSIRTKVYADIQREIKRQFAIDSYKAIKRKHMDKANEIIAAYQPPYCLEEEIYKCNQQTILEG